MLLDPARFRILGELERRHAVFRGELDQLSRHDFVAWPQRAAYEGADWLVFPLFLESYPVDLPVDFERNQARCPASMRVLRDLGVLAAAFSRLEPGCHILPHRDHPHSRILRAHLGLRIPDRALLRVGQTQGCWTEGRCLLFDGQLEHETANLAGEPRTVLLVDFRMNDAECDYAARAGAPTAMAALAASA